MSLGRGRTCRTITNSSATSASTSATYHHAYAFGNWAEREILDSWYFRNPLDQHFSISRDGLPVLR